MTRSIRLIAAASLVALTAAIAHALPVVVTDFAVDPSNAQFTIQPVPKTAPGSENLSGLPTLDFGETSQPDLTANTMKMSWVQATSGQEAQAGWELVFGLDPDIRNQQIILSISPPGGWTDSLGNAFAGPPPSANPPDLFQGIKSLEVRAIDNANAVAGGWGFNTDQDFLFPVGNDGLAVGLNTLANNFMQTVTINVGLGPVAGSATVEFGPGAPVGGFIGPNFITAGNNNFANIKKLQFFENGILQGGINVVPGQVLPGLNNYWDHVTVTPEPATLGLLGIGGLAMMLRRRRA